MLKQLLAAELQARQTLANEKAATANEHASIVAKLHEEFEKCLADLAGLQLIGDYDRPVPLDVSSATNQAGVSVRLGSRISPSCLKLSVEARSPQGAGPSVRLLRTSSRVAEHKVLVVWPGHVPPATPAQALLQELTKHIYMELK